MDLEKFNLDIVQKNFTSALKETDDVNLEDYLKSYEELNKFFTLMGSVFGFVSKDLKSKIDILRSYVSDGTICDKFLSIRSMIEYEREEQLLHKKGYISGSRTLLRLHRGLDFIRLFLKNVGELKNEENTGTVCREAYDKTLAHFHPFLVKTSAQLAMYTLPNREVLLKKVCGSEEDVERALEILPGTLEATAIVYDRIEALYTRFDLHSLP